MKECGGQRRRGRGLQKEMKKRDEREGGKWEGVREGVDGDEGREGEEEKVSE